MTHLLDRLTGTRSPSPLTPRPDASRGVDPFSESFSDVFARTADHGDRASRNADAAGSPDATATRSQPGRRAEAPTRDDRGETDAVDRRRHRDIGSPAGRSASNDRSDRSGAGSADEPHDLDSPDESPDEAARVAAGRTDDRAGDRGESSGSITSSQHSNTAETSDEMPAPHAHTTSSESPAAIIGPVAPATGSPLGDTAPTDGTATDPSVGGVARGDAFGGIGSRGAGADVPASDRARAVAANTSRVADSTTLVPSDAGADEATGGPAAPRAAAAGGEVSGVVTPSTSSTAADANGQEAPGLGASGRVVAGTARAGADVVAAATALGASQARAVGVQPGEPVTGTVGHAESAPSAAAAETPASSAQPSTVPTDGGAPVATVAVAAGRDAAAPEPGSSGTVDVADPAQLGDAVDPIDPELDPRSVSTAQRPGGATAGDAAARAVATPSARLAEQQALREAFDQIEKHRLTSSGRLEMEIHTERFGSLRIEAVDAGDGVQLSLRGDGGARDDLDDLARELRQRFGDDSVDVSTGGDDGDGGARRDLGTSVGGRPSSDHADPSHDDRPHTAEPGDDAPDLIDDGSSRSPLDAVDVRL